MRNIHILSGWYKGDEIFILDITNNAMVLKKSNICCPEEGYHHIVRIGDLSKDEILVIGLLKLYLIRMSLFLYHSIKIN